MPMPLLPLLVLLVSLPFLATRGSPVRDLQALFLIPETFHPVEDASELSLRREYRARKDGRSPWPPGGRLVRIPEPAPAPLEPGAGERPEASPVPHPWFRHYPVFLVCDLPPPSA